jgi:hypothetical protein
MTFEAWYAEYHKEACDLYGGIDCTDPKGIAQAAWDAAYEEGRDDQFYDSYEG